MSVQWAQRTDTLYLTIDLQVREERQTAICFEVTLCPLRPIDVKLPRTVRTLSNRSVAGPGLRICWACLCMRTYDVYSCAAAAGGPRPED